MIKYKLQYSLILLFFVSQALFAQESDNAIYSSDGLTEKLIIEDLEQSIVEAEQAIENFRLSRDTSETINAIISLSIIYSNQGNYGKSYQQIWEALQLAVDSGDTENEIKIYSIIGNLYSYLERTSKAIEFKDKSLDLINSLETDQTELNELKFNICVSKLAIYRQVEQMDKAGKYLDSCYQYINIAEKNAPYFSLEFEKAIYLSHQKKYKESLTTFQEVSDFFTSNNPSFLVLVKTFNGDVYYDMGDLDTAQEYYLGAIQLSKETNKHLDFTPLIHERLAKLYAAKGEHSSAYASMRELKDLDYKMFDSRSKYNSSLLEVNDEFLKYKNEQKAITQNLKLESLSQDKKLADLQRLLLLFALLFTFYFGYNYFKRQRERIKKEKERSALVEKEYNIKKELSEKLATKNDELITYSHIMSHDLKAPLNTIKSFSSLLEKNIIENKVSSRNQDFIGFITSSTDSMGRLIDDLLKYSEIDKKNYEMHETDINEIVNDVLPAFQYEVSQGNTIIEVKELPTIKCNPVILKTVFHNLISNGIKYQPLDKQDHVPKVEIWSTLTDQGYDIYIKDNGIGIKEDYKKKLFKPFERFHAESDYKGTGLGMSICKRIMDAHGGLISLDSSNEHGSTFKLSFPVEKSVDTLNSKSVHVKRNKSIKSQSIKSPSSAK